MTVRKIEFNMMLELTLRGPTFGLEVIYNLRLDKNESDASEVFVSPQSEADAYSYY